MSELEHDIHELKEAIREMSKSKKTDWTKYISIGITILVMGTGIITTWSTAAASIETLETNVGRLEKGLEEAHGEIEEIKLKAVQESSDIKHIKEDISQIKQDIKKLLENE